MLIKRDNEGATLSVNLHCPNDSDINRHYKPTYEIVGDNNYKCLNCGAVLTVKEPVLVHEEDGRLKMEVRFEH